MDFLRRLFDTSDFPARWDCGHWTAGHGWLHVLSDLGVWSAYVAIPCVLVYFLVRRQDLPFRSIFLLFGAFILACGTTHLMEAIIFWWPAYRLAGVIKLCTAVISWATVIALVPVVPRILAMRSPAELERRVEERTAELLQANAELKRERERVRLVADGVPALISYIDADACYRLNNRAYETWFGHPPEAFQGRHVREMLGERAWDVLRPRMEAALSGQTVQYEAEVPYKDGGTRWISTTYTPDVDEAGQVRGFVVHVNDVTAVKRAADAVREQGELLRVTLASVGDAVITTDTQGRVTFLNVVAEKLTGWRMQDAAGRPLPEVFAIVNEQTRQPVENPAIRVLRDGAVVELANHTVLIAADGTERLIDDSAAPIKDERGHVAGCVLIFRDVTDRRRLEKELAEKAAAARLLASIVESSDDAIISKSTDGTILSWNAAAERLFGYPAAKAIGQPITMLIPADLLAEEVRILGRIRGGARVDTFDTVRVRSDGQLVPVALTISPIKDEADRVIGASKIARDVSARHQMEAALRQSEERFRRLVETIPSVVWTAAPDGTITYVNRRWLEFCGITADDNARRWPELVLHPDDYERCVELWSRALREGTEYEIEVRNRRHDGVFRWFVTRAVPMKNGAGRIESWFGVTTDIDDQKRAEEELREAQRRKDDFLATLAHELRGPLAPVRTSLEVLQRAGGDVELQREACATMERQIGHMVRLIDDLLDVSRIGRGKLQLRTERVELAAVVARAVEVVRPHVEAAGHDLQVYLPATPVYLAGDPVRLAQVFANLLTNACKYTRAAGRIQLTAEVRRHEVVVSVKDNGIGIAAHQLPRLFEMFTQVDEALEQSQGGLGIGLALVKGLVDLHGGGVVARSDGPGKGSEFVVTLPTAGEGSTAGATSATVTPGTAKHRILIADDNRDSADSLAKLLRMTGHQPHTAYDGVEALEAAERLQPDVVLLDIGMPRLDGLEAARRIRKQAWGQRMILLAVTGWGDAESRAEARDVGFDGHLTKPVDYAALVRLLAELTSQ